MAELADAGVSKTPESNLVSVRFRYPPPSQFPVKLTAKGRQGDLSGSDTGADRSTVFDPVGQHSETEFTEALKNDHGHFLYEA